MTSEPTVILAVDDDASILKVIEMRLTSGGYQVITAGSAADALDKATCAHIDLAVIDFKLGDDSGVDLMERLQQNHPHLSAIILTAYGTIHSAVDAMKRGACSYLTKPFDGKELLIQIDSCLEKSRLSREVRRLRSMVREQYGFDRIVARSDQMRRVMEQVAMAGETDANVYIQGESGTGKELIAKSLHLVSPRKDGPFVAINCAAIPETLLESELLGYEKGAFTGADRKRIGHFASAHGGSFFFDEISEMPLTMQAKLLRILEEKEFYPLGSSRTITVDTRIIAASNRNLEQFVKDGRFREDLFYRIHVIPIKLPPLRERREDILPLARYFLKKICGESGKVIEEFSPGALQQLLSAPWPGNVRELENAIEYAVAMADGPVISSDLIPTETVSADGIPQLKDAKEAFEKNYIVQLLELTKGNISQAAKMAGKYRADFYALLRKHGLAPDTFRDD
ncbi:MAG: sigma-54 dependent transcriptional regulator [Desulfobacterales bacterium]|jgi:two-component system response regulator GlrR